jgi:anti-anti-sigma factor
MMEIEVKSLKKVEVIAISGRVDSSSAGEFESVLKGLLDRGRHNLVLDMAKLDYMSSAGLRAIVAALKSARSVGGNVVISQPSERMVDTLKLVGFQTLFTQYDNVLDAVDSF